MWLPGNRTLDVVPVLLSLTKRTCQPVAGGVPVSEGRGVGGGRGGLLPGATRTNLSVYVRGQVPGDELSDRICSAFLPGVWGSFAG